MALGKKIEIDPLSEARWARIERGLFEKLDGERIEAESPLHSQTVVIARRRSWKTPLYTAVAVAAAMALSVGAMRLLELRRANVAANNLSLIVTGASDTHLALGENSLDVAPDSAIVASGTDDNGVLVVLDRGSVTCEVAPRKGRPPFVVQSGGVRVRVVGTRFTVSRDGDSARVSVEHGTVEVSAHGRSTFVRAGETWPNEAKATEVVPTSAPPPVRPPAPAPATAKPPRATAPRDASPVPSVITRFPTSVPDEAPPAPSPTPQQLFEQATKLERNAPDRALATYRELAGKGGAWGMNALFAAGRLEADRGHRAAARELLRRYLERYPGGPNAADARAVLDHMR